MSEDEATERFDKSCNTKVFASRADSSTFASAGEFLKCRNLESGLFWRYAWCMCTNHEMRQGQMSCWVESSKFLKCSMAYQRTKPSKRSAAVNLGRFTHQMPLTKIESNYRTMVAMMATCVIASAYQKPPEKVSTFLQPNTFTAGNAGKARCSPNEVVFVCVCSKRSGWPLPYKQLWAFIWTS